MPGQLTLPNFVYRPSVSLVFVLGFRARFRTRATDTSNDKVRLVMLVTWPGSGRLDESSYIEHGI